MLQSQKLEIRSVELRKRLAELSGLNTMDKEQRSELDAKTTELRDVESQRVAALEIEGLESETRATETEDAETRERKAILGKAKLGNALTAVVEGRPLSGAEVELRSAFGYSGDYELPHELFEPTENRAVTPAPGSDTTVNQMPIQPYIYKQGVAGFLGIDMPRVKNGTPAWPVLTTATPSGPKAKGASADETAAAFTITTAAPRRVTGSFRVNVEDMVVFPGMEDALRRDVPQSLANSVENQLLNGDGQSPNINGILKRLTDPSAVTDDESFASLVNRPVTAIDGLLAYSTKDLHLLVGKEVYGDMVSTFQTNTAVSAASYLDGILGGLRMSDHLPAKASNNQQAVVRLGNRPMSIVSALWGGVNLIRDHYTDAAKGEIIVTAFQLISDVHILRAGSAVQVAFKT